MGRSLLLSLEPLLDWSYAWAGSRPPAPDVPPLSRVPARRRGCRAAGAGHEGLAVHPVQNQRQAVEVETTTQV